MTNGVGGLSGGVRSPSSSATIPWERSPEALWRRTATGVAVLPLETGAALVVTGLAAALWEGIARPMTTETLVDLLAAYLPDDRATARHMVGEAVRLMVAAGAIRENVPSGPGM